MMQTPARTLTEIKSLDQQLKALAEPNRLRILELIFQGYQCNCEFGKALQLAPNLISHHLSILRQAGLVEVTRNPNDARWLYYSVNRPALEALNRAFNNFFDLERIQPRRSACAPVDPLEREKNRKGLNLQVKILPSNP
ncbi:MAG: metalloregulator ArsR/SmtB family transcription factor [Anaerolineaceae bacterium]|nr:metalloregulator ArsR/SmtB family transcription factor [Anaerolineaceae bacterium]